MDNKYERLFRNLNYLYFDNNFDELENVDFKIIKRHQPPIEEIADVYYVVAYKEHSLHSKVFWHLQLKRFCDLSLNVKSGHEQFSNVTSYHVCLLPLWIFILYHKRCTVKYVEFNKVD